MTAMYTVNATHAPMTTHVQANATEGRAASARGPEGSALLRLRVVVVMVTLVMMVMIVFVWNPRILAEYQ